MIPSNIPEILKQKNGMWINTATSKRQSVIMYDDFVHAFNRHGEEFKTKPKLQRTTDGLE